MLHFGMSHKALSGIAALLVVSFSAVMVHAGGSGAGTDPVGGHWTPALASGQAVWWDGANHADHKLPIYIVSTFTYTGTYFSDCTENFTGFLNSSHANEGYLIDKWVADSTVNVTDYHHTTCDVDYRHRAHNFKPIGGGESRPCPTIKVRLGSMTEPNGACNDTVLD